MSAIVHERRVGPRAPRFLATAWDAFVGFLLAAISIGVVVFPAFVLGLVGRDGTSGARRDALDWPFAQNGIWSIAANVVVTIGVLLVCAAWISARVGKRAEQPVSVVRTLAIVGLTGYAPYVAYRGLIPLHFALGLLATAFLVRRYALGVGPLDLSGRALASVFATGVLLLCIPAAYGAAHPLWYSSYLEATGATSAPSWDSHRVVFRPKTERTVQYAFLIENFSLRKVTLIDISGTSSPSFLRVVGAEPGFPFPHRSQRVLRGTTIGHGVQQEVTLLLRLVGCDESSGTVTLDRVNVRYRIAGITLSEPVALAIRPTVDCP